MGEAVRSARSIIHLSFGVLARHKKLLVLPLAGTVVAWLGMMIVVYPRLTAGQHWKDVFQDIESQWRARSWREFTVYFLAFYWWPLLSGVFFNVAFYHEAMKALAGDPISLRAGLAFAGGKWRSIFLWSLLAGSLGLVLRTLSEKLGLLGRFGALILNVSWD